MENLKNDELFIETKKMEKISMDLENIILSLKEAVNLLLRLESVKEKHSRYSELLQNDILLMQNDELFNETRIADFKTQATYHTKIKLMNNYTAAQTKFKDLSEYLNQIDKVYYSELMDTIKASLFS